MALVYYSTIILHVQYTYPKPYLDSYSTITIAITIIITINMTITITLNITITSTIALTITIIVLVMFTIISRTHRCSNHVPSLSCSGSYEEFLAVEIRPSWDCFSSKLICQDYWLSVIRGVLAWE